MLDIESKRREAADRRREGTRESPKSCKRRRSEWVVRKRRECSEKGDGRVGGMREKDGTDIRRFNYFYHRQSIGVYIVTRGEKSDDGCPPSIAPHFM